VGRRNQKARAPETLELDVHDLVHDGRGVARRPDGKTVFVSGALSGERVRATVRDRHRNYDEASTDEVLSASAHRVDPRCAHYGLCGGCVLQHLEPTAQIAAKQKTLLDNLQRIGNVAPASVLPALSGAPWGYRRRGRLSVRYVEKKGRTLVGFREVNGKYVADVAECPVLDPRIGTRIHRIGALVSAMDARSSLPQIEIAIADDTVALVFRHLQPLSDDDRRRLVEFARAEDIAVLLQPGNNDTVHPLWPERIELSFRIPDYDVALDFRPLDFIQVNGPMNERMIAHALALLDPQPDEDVLDLFCGLGNFTLPIARRARSVVGVEGEHGLVERARHNALKNGIANAEFFVADLAADQRHAEWATRRYHKLLLDPARAGADLAIAWLPNRHLKRIVYVSCHPGSLARDAGLLVHEHGFKLKAAGVMDMFPHTAHVESIALFER
jgi:23S rRNA (uracil1939-C5)-methyltransferase